MTLSIVIPLYNEERNIASLVKALCAFRQEGLFDDEWVFVNDGSADSTEILLRQCISGMPRTMILSYQENKGKGFAVRQGMLASHGRFRLFTDADLSVPLSAVHTLLPFMQAGFDVIIGSRRLPHSSILVSQGYFRRALGVGFTLLANAIVGLDSSDITCGFKCFCDHAAEDIFHQARIDRWVFDAEILLLAKQSKLKLVEVGVPWSNGLVTRVRLPSDIPRSLLDLLRIRFLRRRSAHGI